MMKQNRINNNPARAMEVAAAQHVSDWVGDTGSVTDTGEGHDPDFYIEYKDGRVGWGEVGWHEERKIRALHREIEKADRVSLPTGSGEWMVHLLPDALVKELQRSLPGFIQQMINHGLSELSPFVDDESPQTIHDEAERLQIEAATRTSTNEDVAHMLSPGFGGALSSDANTIVDWIEGMLADPLYADTTQKLLKRHADERHVFLFAGSLTPEGATRLMVTPLKEQPSRAPTVPAGITHVWAIAPFGIGNLLTWNANDGWTALEIE